MPGLDGITIAQRWMQFVMTTTTIVVSTGAFVWAVMVYALDGEYVQLEDFNAFRDEVREDLHAVKEDNQKVISTAVSLLQCDLMRSEIDDLEATILYKNDHAIPAGLDKVLLEQKLRNFTTRRDCN